MPLHWVGSCCRLRFFPFSSRLCTSVLLIYVHVVCVADQQLVCGYPKYFQSQTDGHRDRRTQRQMQEAKKKGRSEAADSGLV